DKAKLNTFHLDSALDWRGGQNQVYLLCRGLLERGHNVSLVTPPNSELGRRLAGSGATIYPLRQRGELDWPAARAVRQLAAGIKADLLHAHCAHAHATALSAVGRAGRLPVIVSRRVDFDIAGNFLSRRKYLHPSCRYLAISGGVREALTRGGVKPEAVRLVHSGVDPAKFRGQVDDSRLRRELDFPPDSFIVGAVGALVDHKDHATLIRAARSVVDRDPTVIFLIAGDGDQRRPLYNLIDQLELRHNVRLLGHRTDVAACLAGFDLFAASSHLEGLCTSILDAMLMKLPVVATAVGGIPDIVRDGETGLLVPGRDHARLAERILELKQDADLRRQLGARAKKMVLEKFSADRMIDNTLSAYREILREFDAPQRL
ncbi:glycosyltransferase family 4 protein, partial [Candidatus Sumerlaeota bacterium]